MQTIEVIDSHSGGEPTRLVISGFPDLGRGTHTIETPVGNVQATLHEDGSVSVRNVASRRHLHQVPLDVPGCGRVHGDVAWGGNWFFLCSDHGQRVSSDNLASLSSYSIALRHALLAQGIAGTDGAEVDHIELFGPDDQGADRRNFVLCPGNACDRPPCGTGTSAKVACLAADGKLAPGGTWTQASIIGSRFEASYVFENGEVIPTIRGRAYISAEAKLVLDPQDPFVWGIRP